jgi:eukaryotic-like serine/threonine-protein kinase
LSPDRWEQVEDLFGGALERPAEQRAAYLAAATGDAGAKGEARSLLLAHESGGRFDSIVARLCGLDRTVLSPPLLERLLVDQLSSLRAALGERYTIERELGRGGMSTVYLAEDPKHHRSVAVKVLRADLATSLGSERFRREITLAAKLQHPHIVAVYDSGETASGVLWFTMPLIEGESLRDRMRRERQLPVDEALRITREVALALDYAHRHGVIHRDIKPENILLVDGQAMVADFGIARPTAPGALGETLAATGMASGTPAYMSPEQAAGKREVSATTDIFSLGVVLYEMLAGGPPDTEATAEAVAPKTMAGSSRSVRRARPTVPVGVDEALRKALAPAPADRFATAALFAGALDTAERAAAVPLSAATERVIALDPTVGATAGEPVPPAAAPSRPRHRFPTGAAVFGLGLLIGVGLLFAWRAHRRSTSAASAPIRIAVLPFENLGDSADAYFADGMSEELTSRLAPVSGLAVIARTSAIQYKKTTKAIPQIGQELGADYLVEGTVRWEKQPGGTGRVRITPQLVRAKDGTHVWAEQYDKAYGTDIFAMQSDIAERVASALRVTLLAPEQEAVRAVPTKNLQAYDSFLRGQAYSARLWQDWEAERLALESFQQAVKLDQGFALAHAWVAHSLWVMVWSGYDLSLPTGITTSQRIDLARQAAARALALDPDLPFGHLVLGDCYNTLGDTTRANDEYARALRGNGSDADAVEERGTALLSLGRLADGSRQMERAAALDPRNPHRMLGLARALWGIGDSATARVYLDRAIALAPDAPALHLQKVWRNVMAGRMDTARAAMRDGAREAGLGKLLFAAAQNAYWTRLFRILDDEYGPAAKQLSWETFGVDSGDYHLMKAETYRKDGVRGPAYFDSLAAWAEPRVRRGGEVNPSWHILWATGLAGSGKREAAVREIHRLLGDTRYSWSPLEREMTAEACVLAALDDCAMEQIPLAMVNTYALNAALLRLDPIWGPLRGRADFQKLLEGDQPTAAPATNRTTRITRIYE